MPWWREQSVTLPTMPKRKRGGDIGRRYKRTGKAAMSRSNAMREQEPDIEFVPPVLPTAKRPKYVHPTTSDVQPSSAAGNHRTPSRGLSNISGPVQALYNESRTKKPIISERSRRVCWWVIYCEVFNLEPPSMWGGKGGTLSRIKSLCNVNRNSTGSIKEALIRGLEDLHNGIEYDGSPKAGQGGSNRLIPLTGVQAQIVADEMEIGGGLKSALDLVNSCHSDYTITRL